MPFVRIDLQLTEDQAKEAARALAPLFSDFAPSFDKLIADGAQPGKHMAMLYRSKEVQDHMDAGGE